MEHVTYIELSYPNFVLGQIIDPEEANQNNYEIVTKINESIGRLNESTDENIRLEQDKADKSFVNTEISDVKYIISTHKTSDDHDYKYYTKTLLDSGQLDNRYYTKADLIPWLRSGDTVIREEVFVITDANLGDGTFQYTQDGDVFIGELTEDGSQIFRLNTGIYDPGANRLEVIINDTLRRSVASGGIEELSNTEFILSPPEDSGAEITAKYYEKLGVAAEYNIRLSPTKPPANDGKTMWFEVI